MKLQALRNIYDTVRARVARPSLRSHVKSASSFDNIFRSIPDGIFVILGDEILFYNQRAAKILGIQPHALDQRLRLSNEELFSNPHALSAILRASKQSYPVEYVAAPKADENEGLNVYSFRAFPFIHADFPKQTETGPGLQLIVAQDITLFRRNEESKKFVLASLAHEARTPLTSLTMATRLMKRMVDALPNSPFQNLITSSVTDVDRLRGLLEELLTTARSDILAEEPDYQKIDLGKLLQHVIKFYQLKATEKGIQLDYELRKEEKTLWVEVDPTKLTLALSNLIINALQYTSRNGKVAVRISDLKDTVEVRVSGSDSEIGTSDVRGQSEQATNLGIMKDIVLAHGGQILTTEDQLLSCGLACFLIPVKRSNLQSRVEQSGIQREVNGTERRKTQSL